MEFKKNSKIVHWIYLLIVEHFVSILLKIHNIIMVLQ
jgi:hypothetical protein